MLGLTLQEMRDLVRKGLGNITIQDLGNDEVDRFLEMSFWELEAKYPFKEKECRIEFPLVIGTHMYELPNFTVPDLVDVEALQSVSILDSDNTTHPLPRMTQSWWDTVYTHEKSKTKTEFRALPKYYVRMDETLILHPTPDKAYVIRLYFLKTLKTVIETPNEPDLPRSWHEIVVEGAITRGLFYDQDYAEAAQAANFPLSKIRSSVPVEAKEESDSHYAGLEILWEFPDEGVLGD